MSFSLRGFCWLLSCLLSFSSPAQTDRLDSLRSLIPGAGSQEERARAILKYIGVRQEAGNMDSVVYWANEVLSIGRSLSSDELRGLAYCALLNYDFVTTESQVPILVDSAVLYLHRAGDTQRESAVRGIYGFWLCDQYHCEEGLRQLATADSLVQAMEGMSDLNKVKSRLRYFMSLTTCKQFGLIPALLPESARLASRLDHTDKLMQIYKGASTAYLGMNQVDSAEYLLEKMAELLPGLAKRDGEGTYYGQAASLALAQENFRAALEWAQRSIAIFRAEEALSRYAYAPKQVIAGVAAYHLGRFRLSLDYFEAARDYLESVDRPDDLAEFYDHLGDTHAAMGNLAEANRFHLQGRSLRDSLAAARHQARIERLTVEYETERVKRQVVQADLARITAERSAARYRTIGLGSAIVMIMVGGSWLYVGARRRRRRLEYEKQQAELRYALLRAQMNPHFIFNSLNSIQAFFSNHRFGVGNDYLTTFSNLVRRILEQTTQNAISLSEELKTLDMYLQLEKLRLGEVLDYTIHLDPELEPDLIRVPPLVFQPFVENAIWHGVAPKNASGRIDIYVSYDEHNDAVNGRIEDDGVGLQAKKSEGTHRSRGVHITRERLGPHGDVRISNRRADGDRTVGVRTELIIPLKE